MKKLLDRDNYQANQAQYLTSMQLEALREYHENKRFLENAGAIIPLLIVICFAGGMTLLTESLSGRDIIPASIDDETLLSGMTVIFLIMFVGMIMLLNLKIIPPIKKRRVDAALEKAQSASILQVDGSIEWQDDAYYALIDGQRFGSIYDDTGDFRAPGVYHMHILDGTAWLLSIQPVTDSGRQQLAIQRSLSRANHLDYAALERNQQGGMSIQQRLNLMPMMLSNILIFIGMIAFVSLLSFAFWRTLPESGLMALNLSKSIANFQERMITQDRQLIIQGVMVMGITLIFIAFLIRQSAKSLALIRLFFMGKVYAAGGILTRRSERVYRVIHQNKGQSRRYRYDYYYALPDADLMFPVSKQGYQALPEQQRCIVYYLNYRPGWRKHNAKLMLNILPEPPDV